MGKEVYWLWLELVFGVGGKRLWVFADKESDPEELYERISAGEAEGLADSERKRAAENTLSQAQQLLDRAAELGQRVVSIDSVGYPERLRALDDPPAVLFYRGDMGLTEGGAVLHMVGSRTPTRYTESLVRVMCGELTARGFVLSSGFAEGADTQVIETVLDRGGRALTVYPTSLEGEYPKGGEELKERLAEKGLLVGEYPPESRARMNFQRRNRLAVALSSAVIITEASAESRGLDNVRQAQRLGRPVLAVPPHLLYSKEYFGQRDLLREGCEPIFDGGDAVRVLAERNEIDPDSYGLRSGGAKVGGGSKGPSDRQKAAAVVGRELNSGEARILSLLRERGEMLMDEISAESGLSMAEALVHITDLELEGLVQSLPGRRYRKAER